MRNAMKSRCEAGATHRTVTPKASKGGVAPASSEFGRVRWVRFCIPYLDLPLRVRFTEQVKRKTITGEAVR